jgi:hypothetical protein
MMFDEAAASRRPRVRSAESVWLPRLAVDAHLHQLLHPADGLAVSQQSWKVVFYLEYLERN